MFSQSGFVIQNSQIFVVFDLALYSAFIRRVLWFAGGIHLQSDCIQNPFAHERMKAFDTSSFGIKLSPSYSVQTHFNVPSIGPGNELKDLKYTLTIFSVSYIICHKQRRGLVRQSYLLFFARRKQTKVYRPLSLLIGSHLKIRAIYRIIAYIVGVQKVTLSILPVPFMSCPVSSA